MFPRVQIFYLELTEEKVGTAGEVAYDWFGPSM